MALSLEEKGNCAVRRSEFQSRSGSANWPIHSHDFAIVNGDIGTNWIDHKSCDRTTITTVYYFCHTTLLLFTTFATNLLTDQVL